MLSLTTGELRALTPSCSAGMWLRLATFAVVTVATLMLLYIGLSLVATLVTVAVMAAVTILMTMARADRVARLARALLSALDHPAPAGAGAR